MGWGPPSSAAYHRGHGCVHSHGPAYINGGKRAGKQVRIFACPGARGFPHFVPVCGKPGQSEGGPALQTNGPKARRPRRWGNPPFSPGRSSRSSTAPTGLLGKWMWSPARKERQPVPGGPGRSFLRAVYGETAGKRKNRGTGGPETAESCPKFTVPTQNSLVTGSKIQYNEPILIGGGPATGRGICRRITWEDSVYETDFRHRQQG